jgi:acyl-CoA synthetase (AMP-forming)/AMP-acid ligase II
VRSTREVSYGELNDQVNSWRDVLASWELTGTDRVGLLIGDPIDFAICFLALLALGVWVAPMDPTVSYADGRQLEERIANLNVRCIIADRSAPPGTSVQWHEVSELARSERSHQLPGSGTAVSGGGVMLASSGTTGTPKIMALPSEQLVHAASLIALHNHLERSDRGLNPLPLWHINAEVVALLATLVAGSCVALDDRFHRTGFWSVVEHLKITWINAVPAIISRLSTLQDGECVPSGVRFIRSASAPLSPSLLQHFEREIGVPVIESYGMTEAASQICANSLIGPRKVGSVGRAVGVEVRVVATAKADTTTLSAASEVGRVEIRGATVIRRYEGAGYEDRFDPDGWLDTGDLGYLDDEGYLFLVGRSDDVINRGGEKIFPREIEDVILGVRGVVGAAVIGVSHDVFGQVPSAYVQLDGVSETTPLDEVRIATKEIHDALVAAFSRARRPVNINVVTRLPAHATGKIQKKALGDGTVPVLFQEHVS